MHTIVVPPGEPWPAPGPIPSGRGVRRYEGRTRISPRQYTDATGGTRRLGEYEDENDRPTTAKRTVDKILTFRMNKREYT